MSLRARVLVGAALIGVVLAAGALVTTRAIRTQLVAEVDDRLAAARRPGGDLVDGPPAAPRRPLSELYAAVVRGGRLVTVAEPDLLGDDAAPPAIDAAHAAASAETGEAFTASATDGSRRWRVRAGTGPRGTVFAVALPLDDVEQTMRRVVAVEVAATAAVLAVVGVVAWWVVHLGVRPLKQMTATASAIASGDLSARVPEAAPPGTEAADLGGALNRMLAQIETAFEERRRSEERVRRFAADASHELRTPITTIRGYAELYRSGALDDPAELAEAMRRTEEEAVRMGRLVEDLLTLARIDQGRPLGEERVDLAAVATDAVRDARAAAPGRAITVDAPAPVMVSGDEDRLRQVVANVVGNAVVHTGEGAAVAVAVQHAGGWARLTVTDDGPGMPADVAARAFERFYRADPARSRHRGGTGLGLAIVRAVVDAHGGAVHLDTAPGRGTTVTIDLPVSDPG